MTNKISLQELQRLAIDPEVPEETLKPYFTADSDSSHAFRPAIVPNPETVDIPPGAERLVGGMALGNALSRFRRRNRFNLRLFSGDSRPILISEGDSWFQFPVFLHDVIDHLYDDFTIRSLGAAGATAADMLADGEYKRELRRHADRVEAFLFSAAGNDVIGEDRNGNPEILKLLNRRQGGEQPIDLVNRSGLDAAIDFLRNTYLQVVSDVRAIPGLGDLPILVHGYDVPFAGRVDDPRDPLWAGPDQWLGAPFRSLGIDDPATQRAVLEILIGELYDMLESLAATDPHLHVVDARGTLPRRQDWTDEIHGTDAGFGRVAARFADTFDRARAARRPRAATASARRRSGAPQMENALLAEQAVAVIDPGHGGDTEIGGSSANNATGPAGTLEKTLTLELGLLTEEALEDRGHKVFMTRKSDRNLSLAKRAQLARDNAADVFVSIHFNGWNTPSVQGTETFRHTRSDAASQMLAGTVQSAVQRATGLRDRGVKKAGFGVLRPDRHQSETAACLLEVSFLTDPAEEQRLIQDQRYMQRIATALADGIEDYLETLRGVAVAAAFETLGTEDIGDATELSDAEAGAAGGALPPHPPRLLRHPVARRSAAAALPGMVGIADPARFLDAWRSFRRERAGLPNRFEAKIGIDNSLPIDFLDKGAAAARAVARIRTSGIDYRGIMTSWVGTGFVVAPDILLTNHHVLNSLDTARQATVEFLHRDGPDGRPTPGETLRLDPTALFVTSPAIGGLDYTFVRIDGDAHDRFGQITMQRGVFTSEKDERANVIHHPGGRPQRVSLQDNRVLDFDPQLLHYTSDTEGGSSGAPVFDNTWRLIALHHAFEELPEGIGSPDGGTSRIINEGIKLSAITIDLETRASEEIDSQAARTVLQAIHGSDSITGYFGARGRRPVPADTLERVVDVYNGTADDIDVAFWNVEWFNRHYRERVGDVARIVADLNLDIWAFAETSPEATEALVDHLGREFGHRFEWAASEPDASSGRQTTTVIWNPLTVRGRSVDWPDEIEPLLTADSRDVPNLNFEAVDGLVFNRYPGLFRFEALGRREAGFAPFSFNLVPLHLKAFDEGAKRRRIASEILAAVIKRMIERHGASRDWLVGGDVNAELATGQFGALTGAGFLPMSAEDEAEGAISYLKGPRSLIDTIFLSPNLGKRFGADDFFIYAGDARMPDFVRDISDHRPVMARLSLARESGPAVPLPDDHAASPGTKGEDDLLAALLDRAFRDPGQFLRDLARWIDERRG